MQTILQIVERAGGWHPGLSLKIENAPYVALVIEAIDESGPTGLPALSVAQYSERNGNLMRDPEMRFELKGTALDPFYYGDECTGIEQWSRKIERGLLYHHITLHYQHKQFAKHWDEMLRRQSFLEAFERQMSQGA